MITKIYEQPEIEIYKFSAEAGFLASLTSENDETNKFGFANDGSEDDWN